MLADEVWKFFVSAGMSEGEKWWGRRGFGERRNLEKVRGTTKK